MTTKRIAFVSSLITAFLAFGMLCTGTLNTITTKFQDMRIVKGIGDGPPTPFEHPFFQTGAMFIGEFACMFVYLFTLTAFFKAISTRIKRLINGEETPQDTANTSEEDVALLRAEENKNTRYTNPLLFAIPAMCDLGGTTLMNVGLFYTDASVYQMLRGILVVFNGILAVVFLKQKLYPHHWLGILLIVTGTAMVGLSSYLFKHVDSAHAPRNPLLGNALVICAQVLAAVMMITEEKILTTYPAQPLQVVGWEGFWGLSFVSIALFILYWIPGSDYHSLENSVYAFAQLAQDWRLFAGVLGSIFSIAFFNFFGISITQRISSTTRSAIDSCRTFFIWMVSLALGWEVFQWLQLGGFLVVVSGTFLFNEVIRIPFYHTWFLNRKERDIEMKREKERLKNMKE
jgi:drug/metabolite transporter (DMT)-like permease